MANDNNYDDLMADAFELASPAGELSTTGQGNVTQQIFNHHEKFFNQTPQEHERGQDSVENRPSKRQVASQIHLP